jgi:multiple sugar transport system permease protein
MAPTNAQMSAADPSGGASRRRQLSNRAIINLFIWPTLILLIVMNIFPLFYSLYLSFTDYSAIARNQPPVWIAFDNFRNILRDEQLWEYFATSGRYALMSVGLQMVVGFGLAMLIREKFRGSGIVTTLILIPMMLSAVVVGLFWKLIYNPTFGFFNYVIGLGSVVPGLDMLASRLGGQPAPGLALFAVALVDVWMWSPFVMLLVLSGLKAIPDYLYEAAVIDRASSWFHDGRWPRHADRVDRRQPLPSGISRPMAYRSVQRLGLYHPYYYHRYQQSVHQVSKSDERGGLDHGTF